jgi:hypothetical protein
MATVQSEVMPMTRAKVPVPPTPPTHPLVGKWFHSYDAEQPTVIRWQGQVLAAITPDVFLVQLFEWFCGMPTKQRLVSLIEMLSWSFYATEQQKDEAYDKYAIQRDKAFEAAHPLKMTPRGDMH